MMRNTVLVFGLLALFQLLQLVLYFRRQGFGLDLLSLKYHAAGWQYCETT